MCFFFVLRFAMPNFHFFPVSFAGNEIMYYQPDFMDLEDVWNEENIRTTPPPSPVNILSSELNTPVLTPASPGFFPSNKRRRN